MLDPRGASTGTLRVSTQGLRIIDKKGIEAVLVDVRDNGHKV